MGLRVLLVGHHSRTINPLLFQITYLKNGRVMIYIKSTNLVGTRMFRDKRGVLERGTIEDCRTTGGHLQVIGGHTPELSLTLPIHILTTIQNLENIMHTCRR
jgi:hypothetical protein